MTYDFNIFTLAATDLANHLSCQQLAQQGKLVARDEIKDHVARPIAGCAVDQKGNMEAAYVESLRRRGVSFISLRRGPPRSRQPSAAMQSGVDLIVQAPLALNKGSGYADILIKVPLKSNLGDWSYEVYDTKLSRNTRGRRRSFSYACTQIWWPRCKAKFLKGCISLSPEFNFQLSPIALPSSARIREREEKLAYHRSR